MGVEALGTDLLGEVKVEGLDEVGRDPNPSLNLYQHERLTLCSYYVPYES